MATIYRDIVAEIAKNEGEKGESEKDRVSPRERISSFAKEMIVKRAVSRRDTWAHNQRKEYASPQCDRLKINVARGCECTRQINAFHTRLDSPSMSLNT